MDGNLNTIIDFDLSDVTISNDAACGYNKSAWVTNRCNLQDVLSQLNPQPIELKPMICTQCGGSIHPIDHYCEFCGVRYSGGLQYG